MSYCVIRHPFTQAQFNLTGGYLADEDFLINLEKSVASSGPFQRAEASLFKGDTKYLIDLSQAHNINLVGYVYNKTDIEEAILNIWKTDNINPDIQIVDLEYCYGEYGMKLTRLSYLAYSSGHQVMPWEISQDKQFQIANALENLDLNRVTSSVVSWPFTNTFELMVNLRPLTFNISGTVETISSGWRRCLESNGTTCKEKCNVSVVLGRPERTIIDLRNTITRLWYLPEYIKDHKKDTWITPDSYGTMASMGELLDRFNISVVRAPVGKLYRILLLHERQMSEFKNVVENALRYIWTSFHSVASADSVKIQTIDWNVNYLSDNGTRVTVIGYRVSVLEADSSFSSLTEPQMSIVEEGLQKYDIASCSCTPHRRREIYVLGDILPYNFSDFEEAISDAWKETNDFFQGNISVKIVQGTTGFKSSDGKDATQLTYFVSASSGGIPIDERDLDEPCVETLNKHLNTTGSAIANTLQMKPPKEQDDFPWWFVVIGIVLCCALMLVTITVFSLIVRNKRYSKSRTLKQHPEDIDAYDQEHFSMEPTFDIPAYNIDEPDADNDSVKAETYTVNS
ncbi:hypothetical protein CHS0354_028249 [Potamilus streckersoni]|uniref:Uncharacterized protein n=1 Tax=Potamilus streckersoni TaxID=2493646 RepID=A0AAE0VIV5_9BIVA|nr:hypothetical protein CHS0354_028249 [Potamilus streckersoni]